MKQAIIELVIVFGSLKFHAGPWWTVTAKMDSQFGLFVFGILSSLHFSFVCFEWYLSYYKWCRALCFKNAGIPHTQHDAQCSCVTQGNFGCNGPEIIHHTHARTFNVLNVSLDTRLFNGQGSRFNTNQIAIQEPNRNQAEPENKSRSKRSASLKII